MKAGRKPVEDRKVPQSVSIRQSLLRKIRSEGIDISTVVENALERALGRDPKEIEMERLKEDSGRKDEREELP